MYEEATLAGPPRLWERPYPGTIDQVRHVRAALRQFLGDCPVADDVVQLLSELCANAIAHSDSRKRGGTFTVRVQHFPDSYVWGEVEDQGSAWDGNLSRSARHPHGLYLLERLASECGVERIRRAHIVWFRIDYPPQQLRASRALSRARPAPRPADARHRGEQRPAMTETASAPAAGPPGRDDLTPRVFPALYQDFDLRTVGVMHIVTPKGTPVFTGDSLGQIARQISDHEHGNPAATQRATPPADHLPARPRS
jgi:anti-sigma regulatory factor (Ser/Thr protein kinase)